MDSTVKALLYTCETSAAELRELSDRLSTVGPRQAQSVLKAIQKTSDVLSSALDRLSFYVDEIPADDGAKGNTEPFTDRMLLLAAQRLSFATDRGLCARCSGIKNQ